MKGFRNHRLLLWSAATDRTFSVRVQRGASVLMGKCIHCNRKLVLSAEGAPISSASLEHIVPRTHGGTNRLDNLAVACSRCNGQKGCRHDLKRWSDPKLQEVIQTLQTRRRARWRRPPEGMVLPRLPDDVRPPEELWPIERS